MLDYKLVYSQINFTIVQRVELNQLLAPTTYCEALSSPTMANARRHVVGERKNRDELN